MRAVYNSSKVYSIWYPPEQKHSKARAEPQVLSKYQTFQLSIRLPSPLQITNAHPCEESPYQFLCSYPPVTDMSWPLKNGTFDKTL